MASDREGFRVEAVLDGRRLPVLEGTAERHAAVQSDLKERNEGTTSVKGHYVTDHFRFPRVTVEGVHQLLRGAVSHMGVGDAC